MANAHRGCLASAAQTLSVAAALIAAVARAAAALKSLAPFIALPLPLGMLLAYQTSVYADGKAILAYRRRLEADIDHQLGSRGALTYARQAAETRRSGHDTSVKRASLAYTLIIVALGFLGTLSAWMEFSNNWRLPVTVATSLSAVLGVVATRLAEHGKVQTEEKLYEWWGDTSLRNGTDSRYRESGEAPSAGGGSPPGLAPRAP